MVFLIFILGLLWGSFLNVVAYRIIRGYSLLGRSFCPQCHTQLTWYDLLPVLSLIVLWGRCRNCKAPISFLYPFIELLTAALAVLTYSYIDQQYWIAISLFFSALIVTIRTDFETMLISRYTTFLIIPFGLFFAFLDMLAISLHQSIMGTVFGYVLLWMIATLFYKIRKIEGIGEGDLDLLSLIGAFTGIAGAWFSLFIGAFLGTLAGIVLTLKNKRYESTIAFGPWLAFGAIIYVFTQHILLSYFFF